jgi:hypothetical protein
MFVVLSGGLLPVVLWGQEVSDDVPSPQHFVLTVHEQRLSLRAREASLSAILAQIGRALGIDVVAHLPADETITVAFDQLPLDEALKQLSPNYAYVVDTARGDRRITKIVVLSKGDPTLQGSWTPPALPSPERLDTPESRPAAQHLREPAARPAPFQFEFDPSKAMQEGK